MIIRRPNPWLSGANSATARIVDHRKMKLEDSPAFKVS